LLALNKLLTGSITKIERLRESQVLYMSTEYIVRLCMERGGSQVKISIYNATGKMVLEEEIQNIQLLDIDGEVLVYLDSLYGNTMCISIRYACMPRKTVKQSILRLSRC